MTPILAFGLGNPLELIPLALLIFVLPMVFWIVEIVDAARRDFGDQTTKVVWILVIVVTHAIGALVYYFVGKKQGTLPGKIKTL